ncbi:hypothetical protein Hypma_002778 [Hypsizygus marmoreus]|uniref:Uncharacterized protein n=1 Tax=Hypsizygus marmoreus TaxID=39966 RepID=A0A369J3D2_HYPMA|nr:hypothetical protein Hypma_002778 [Hypsizygus marmoreus]
MYSMSVRTLAISLLSTIATCMAQHSVLSLPYNFTIAALNTTFSGVNANRTGVPLVLGQNGATTGASFYVTSTYASYPYNDYPSMALMRGSLRAFTSEGEWLTNATAMRSGRPLGWITSRYYTQPAAKGYSAVRVPTEIFPLLATHGFAHLWSLCRFPGFRGQTNVVFNVSADIPLPPYLEFDPADCYPVTLNIIRVYWQMTIGFHLQ